MVRVISIRHSTPAGFKLTKLFGIYDFSVAKDSGKVLIIIIYCYNNNYYFYLFIFLIYLIFLLLNVYCLGNLN